MLLANLDFILMFVANFINVSSVNSAHTYTHGIAAAAYAEIKKINFEHSICVVAPCQ